MDMHNLELDIGCYGAAVYHESNTQSLQEKLGVLNVVRNRLKSGRWGNTVCSVVYSNGQFIGVTDQSHDDVDTKAFLETELFVLDAIVFNKYANPVADALYFHDDSIKTMSGWGKKKVKIGRMVFY
jgi:spore germination cell wall hydrolase CwlJ-like protein